MNITEQIHALGPELITIRREFHRHPELGQEEHTTSRMIREFLDKWGISYIYPVAGTGITAVIYGGKSRDPGKHGCSPGRILTRCLSRKILPAPTAP